MTAHALHAIHGGLGLWALGVLTEAEALQLVGVVLALLGGGLAAADRYREYLRRNKALDAEAEAATAVRLARIAAEARMNDGGTDVRPPDRSEPPG